MTSSLHDWTDDAIEQAVETHAQISRRMVESLGTVPHSQDEPAAAPTQAAGDQVKLKEGLKPTNLTLDFNPQEFQAWQNITELPE